ncbi:uncharacterized protein AMSG_08918 [Thecamonas trahens ATCC 50062]|uniref:Uncharacterized protein n=1 Tax=Thecamonas trahens ATCC 50062 TaxID=461836 RepID=A0A0L0DM75_THETB|nr:hypothetical protein AMSG_08918 [Thecamonas trahens ATCC 50062]KNC53412.1 hypothetical protein AMSG_08918 [Thecamonas trahens ATCC 50062]|eukprot:XP_013754451.1 hypothetical protein AMSG_08918 [Thecamonas trahens ATCC 50062]
MFRGRGTGHGTASVHALDSVRILVVGDSGVGKTSLVASLTGAGESRPSWTIGANVEVVGHTHSTSGKQYFIELIDVGGAAKYADARSVFYANADGVMLVHDLANANSFANLFNWLSEIAFAAHRADIGHEPDDDSAGASSAAAAADDEAAGLNIDNNGRVIVPPFDMELYSGSPIASCPLLLVANKTDAVDAAKAGAASRKRSSSGSSSSGLTSAAGFERFFSLLNSSSVATCAIDPDSLDGEAFASFFDRVIETRLAVRGGFAGSSPARRGSIGLRSATSVLYSKR